MYAVIQTGGKQYRVAQGDKVKLELLTAAVGETVEFDKVLMVANDGDVKVGAPFVSGGKVTASVLNHGRADKVITVKLRRRKNSRRQKGHRQHFTEVKIETIN